MKKPFLFFVCKCAHSPTREEPTNNVAFLHVVWCKFVLKGPDPSFCQIINFSQLKIHTSSIYIAFMLGVIWSWIQRTGIPRFPKKTGPLKVFGSSGSTPKQAARSARVQRNVTKLDIPKEKKSWKFPSKIINGAMSISTNQPNPNYNIWERDLQLTIIFCVLVCVCVVFPKSIRSINVGQVAMAFTPCAKPASHMITPWWLVGVSPTLSHVSGKRDIPMFTFLIWHTSG